MGIPLCTQEETPAANGTVAPKQAHMEVDIHQDHQAIVARACRKMNRLMLPFALLFRSATTSYQKVTASRQKQNALALAIGAQRLTVSSLILGPCVGLYCDRLVSRANLMQI